MRAALADASWDAPDVGDDVEDALVLEANEEKVGPDEVTLPFVLPIARCTVTLKAPVIPDKVNLIDRVGVNDPRFPGGAWKFPTEWQSTHLLES